MQKHDPNVPPLHIKKPFWKWSDLGLWTLGLMALIAGLYQVVLRFGLSAVVAGAITDVPGQLGILYAILRCRYKRSPWIGLGWTWPSNHLDWVLAGFGGICLAIIVMSVENPSRLQLHFHNIAYAVIFGGLLAPVVEETIFRGAVLPLVLRVAPPILAALATGILFALYHGVYHGMPPLSALAWISIAGTAYGFIKIRSQSTLVSAFMHACYNLSLFVWQGA